MTVIIGGENKILKKDKWQKYMKRIIYKKQQQRKFQLFYQDETVDA